MPPTEPLLVVDRLRTVFGEGAAMHVAVDDVSLSMRRGEILGLAGESGSGKTVTALSLLRLVPPPGRVVAGRVLLDNRDVLAMDDAELWRLRGRKVGFVFQEPSAALNPVFSIGFQIEETLIVHGLARGRAARERAIALLESVHMPDPAHRARDYPHQLSGGQRQRAMLALALAGDPDLLIADEPTTALDATVQVDILNLLHELREARGMSMLVITHDLGVVAEMADTVAIMRQGRIVEHGPAREIFEAPAQPYTRDLLSSMPGRGTRR